MNFESAGNICVLLNYFSCFYLIIVTFQSFILFILGIKIH